ncbi:MAG: TIR domain-containing protein [Anaerolineae bacterium]|nr:TIR domain-containing protein [Anaerolineae bacterium]
MSQPIIFISYSHDDEAEKERLLTHLGGLQREGLIHAWSDDDIVAGTDWQSAIHQTIYQAKIALLLISANFLDSTTIIERELPLLLERHRNEGLIIYPIIIRACAWEAIHWLAALSIRPRTRRPVWGDGGVHVDEDLAAIAQEVATLVQHITLTTPPPEPPQPLSSLPANPAPVMQTSTPVPTGKILVVEDKKDWRDILEECLVEEGFEVDTVGSGQEAKAKLKTGDFLVATIDMNLNEADSVREGQSLLRHIQRNYKNIQCIVVSGEQLTNKEIRNLFREYQVYDFMGKGTDFDYIEFVEMVAKALEEARKR